jgi:hypothetical protein
MPVELKDLATFRQVSQESNGVFTEPGLRWLRFNGDRNGFNECVIELSGKVLIDRKRFRQYLENRRAKPVTV